MISPGQLARWLVLTALTTPALFGQDVFLDRWNAAKSSQPSEVEFQITAPKTKFYLGELIPLSYSFTTTQPQSFRAARFDRRLYAYRGDQFIVDPMGATEDPLRGLPGENGGIGGFRPGDAVLDPDKPLTLELILNEWLRFQSPGTHRIYVSTRRVRPVSGTTPIEMVSNVLTFEVLGPPAEWIAEQIVTTTSILDRPLGNGSEAVYAHERAALTLRFLNTPESGIALAKRIPSDGNGAELGILDSHHRPELLAAMSELLTAPDHAISGRFVSTMAQLAVLVDEGLSPPLPTDGGISQAWQAESQRRAGLTTKKHDEFVTRLVAALPEKQPQARMTTSGELLRLVPSHQPLPAWTAGIVRYMTANFRSLPYLIQTRLLVSGSPFIRHDEGGLPILRDLYADPPVPPEGYPPITETLARRIYELDPAEGRRLILAEFARAQASRFSDTTLLLLTDETLPELDAVFRASRVPPAGVALVIARYASAGILADIKAAYQDHEAFLHRQNRPHCPGPILFYFLKHDPEFGEQVLKHAFENIACYDLAQAAQQLGEHAWSPALERLAIQYLTSPQVPIKRGAAELLGKYGSPAAQAPLWETIEYFHTWWKDREEDLRKPIGRESALFEQTLIFALGRANHWKLTAPDLARLRSLCSSVACRQGDWIPAAP